VRVEPRQTAPGQAESFEADERPQGGRRDLDDRVVRQAERAHRGHVTEEVVGEHRRQQIARQVDQLQS